MDRTDTPSTDPPSRDDGGTAVVLVKSVPVGGAHLRAVDGRLTRDGVAHGLDPVNEVAVEVAVRARAAGLVARVIAVTMGPDAAADALRRAMALGCDDSLLVTDPALAGADVRTTARVLAAAVRRCGGGLVVAGYESLDGSSGVVPAAVATLLGWPVVSRASDVQHGDGVVRAERDAGAGRELVEAPGPLVVSVVEGTIVPPYPSVRASLAARSHEPPVVALADLGVAVDGGAVREHHWRLEAVPVVPRDPVTLSGPEAVDAVLALVGGAGDA